MRAKLKQPSDLVEQLADCDRFPPELVSKALRLALIEENSTET